jgi:di/tricarboxylate transporter
MTYVDIIGIILLIIVFAMATLRPINLGALALAGAFTLAVVFAGKSIKDVLDGFPADLFVLLLGVTFLFGIATANGTIEWMVDTSVHAVGGRAAYIPWIVFFIAAVPTTAGALGPAGVALLAPLGMRLAHKYKMDPRMIGLMVIYGSAAGNFSPVNALGAIVNQTIERAGLNSAPLPLFFANFAFNVVVGVAVFVIFGGLRLLRERRDLIDESGAAETEIDESLPGPQFGGSARPAGAASALAIKTASPATRHQIRSISPPQVVTLVIIAVTACAALVFDLNIGVVALIGAITLKLITPKSSNGAEKLIAWNTVLLICGIVTYVALLQQVGTVDRIGNSVTSLNVPLLAAFSLCLIGAAVSAFASSTGILGALIPLSVPFLLQGHISVAAFVIALSICATAVDSTPFSTVGSLVVANTPESDVAKTYRGLLKWGLSMIVAAPVATFVVFLLPSIL